MGAREDLLAVPDDMLRRGDIAEAALVFMDFTTGARRWWTGVGDLFVAGQTWQGTGDIIEIGEIETNYQVTADPLTFRLAATDEMIALAMQSETAVRGRAVVVYAQLFAINPTDGSDPWAVLGTPFALYSGTMQQLTYRADGPTEAAIELACEGLFARRNAPPRGRLTDRDQQAREPGDRGLERVSRYVDYETKWIT